MSSTSKSTSSKESRDTTKKAADNSNTRPYSFAKIVLLSIFALASAVLVAYYLPSNVEVTRGASARLFSSVSRLFATKSVVSSSRFLEKTATAVSFASQSPVPVPVSKWNTTVMRPPVYFLSHGGVSLRSILFLKERISLTNLPFDPLSQPNIMYQHDHPAHRKLQEIGREITTKVKPKAVVVFSGHWQAGRDTIQVNTAEVTDLIYE